MTAVEALEALRVWRCGGADRVASVRVDGVLLTTWIDGSRVEARFVGVPAALRAIESGSIAWRSPRPKEKAKRSPSPQLSQR